MACCGISPVMQIFSASRELWEQNGIVSSVCHGAVGLLNIKLRDGSRLIDGKRLTGFSNEEKRAELDTHVPFMTSTTRSFALCEQAWPRMMTAGTSTLSNPTGQDNLSQGLAVLQLRLAQSACG